MAPAHGRINGAHYIAGFQYRAGYDLLCFGGLNFQSFIEPGGERIGLCPGIESPEFLLNTRAGASLFSAADYRAVAPILCCKCESV
jgi:hypothetical protein